MTGRFHIAMPLDDGPTGGGNQFLKALRGVWRRRGVYADDPAQADVVLFNSFQFLREAANLRARLPNAVFLHRADGVTRLYNAPDDPRDAAAIHANRFLADGTIFQTAWCRDAHLRLGWPADRPQTVIGNAPDPAIFHPGVAHDCAKRPRLVVTSWSNNANKGVDILDWLEANAPQLDFDVTFVGNASRPLANIRQLAPVPSAELAEILRGQDIFLMPARNECCSNALAEALACGLPAVARNDGGNPEVLGKGGELFDRADEIPAKVAMIAADYGAYRAAIPVFDIEAIARRYEAFADSVAVASPAVSYYRRFGSPAAWLARFALA
ncbi:MAG: glycosyltransferase family 4 protein [Alphaproteobacteria bacterium]|nr:glycosyltransferase family 4 protein [Alphaproteobacteria bacterium]